MKIKPSVTALTAALSLFVNTALPAQEDPEPGAAPGAQASLKTAPADVQKAQDEAKDQYNKAGEEFDRAHKEFQKMAQASDAVSVSSGSGPNAFSDRLQRLTRLAPGQGAGKGLVIRSSESDPKEQANLEEDLAVMSHILTKAVEEKVGSQPHAATAMGIDVFYSPASNPLQNLYLEGYGALFMLNVRFPLLAPPAGEERKDKPEVDSDWEAAKQELYGPHTEGRMVVGAGEQYDEEKVNRLKAALVEALKNATNIRDLKPDDSVTVCVFGGPSAGQARYKVMAQRGNAPGQTRSEVMVSDRGGAPLRQTILTLRVKKSDIDGFAKGKMTLEEFRKRARITTYTGSAEGGGFAAFGGAGTGGYGFWSGGSGGGLGGGFGGGGVK